MLDISCSKLVCHCQINKENYYEEKDSFGGFFCHSDFDPQHYKCFRGKRRFSFCQRPPNGDSESDNGHVNVLSADRLVVRPFLRKNVAPMSDVFIF